MLFHVLIIFLFKMSCLEILYQNFYSGVSSLFILAIKVFQAKVKYSMLSGTKLWNFNRIFTQISDQVNTSHSVMSDSL